MKIKRLLFVGPILSVWLISIGVHMISIPGSGEWFWFPYILTSVALVVGLIVHALSVNFPDSF